MRQKVTRNGKRRFISRVFPGSLVGCCNGGARPGVRSGHFAQWLGVKDQARLLDELRGTDIAVERGTGLELYPRLKGDSQRQSTWRPADGRPRRSERRDCHPRR